MTSNTEPSGEAFASHEYTPAYYGFNSEDDVSSWVAGKDVTDAWLAYKFTEPTCIKYVGIRNRNYDGDANNRVKTFKVQASNDKTTWTDITDIIDRGIEANAANYRTLHVIYNNRKYLMYRVCLLTQYTGIWPGIAELQFYGRS